MAFRWVASIDDVPSGHTKYITLDCGPVLLANIGGEIFALAGLCPHRGNSLEGATLLGHLLDCPWHHFQYDVRTGLNHFPANVFPDDLPQARSQLGALAHYAVELRKDGIWVDLHS